MEYQKNIKDIKNATIKSGSFKIRYTRITPLSFESNFEDDDKSVMVCKNCGEFIYYEDDIAKHYNCKPIIIDEYRVAQEIINAVNDDEENLVSINEGFKDQIYLRLFQ